MTTTLAKHGSAVTNSHVYAKLAWRQQDRGPRNVNLIVDWRHRNGRHRDGTGLRGDGATHLGEQLGDHGVDCRADQFTRRGSSELQRGMFESVDTNQVINSDDHVPSNFQTRQRGSFSFARPDGTSLPTSPDTTPMSSQRPATWGSLCPNSPRCCERRKAMLLFVYVGMSDS